MSGYLGALSELSGKATVGEYGVTIVKLQDSPAQCTLACFLTQLEPDLFETYHVPYQNVLWCEERAAGEIELAYAVDLGENVSLHTEVLSVGAYAHETHPDVAQQVLALAYKQSQPAPRVLVVLNNHGGQGNARKLYHTEILPVLRAAHVEYTYIETGYSRHATEIARELELDEYDIVACCSGDGVPHEIINGFFQRPDRARAFDQIALTQLPCGSGNALSLSSHGTSNAGRATLRMLKLARSRMDAMAVQQNGTTTLLFLSQAFGAIADADIGTEHLRWMGAVRFDLGVAHRLLAKTTYPCDLYVQYAMKDKSEIQGHYDKHRVTLSDTRPVQEEDLEPRFEDTSLPGWEQLPLYITDDLNIFYVGKMPYVLGDAQFFPAALPDDGCMDLVVTTAKTSFFKMAKLLFSVDRGGHVHSPDVLHAKIKAYKLVPRVRLDHHYLLVDGESFPVQPLQVEVLSKVLTVLLDDGFFVDTCFTQLEDGSVCVRESV